MRKSTVTGTSGMGNSAAKIFTVPEKSMSTGSGTIERILKPVFPSLNHAKELHTG